MTLNSYTGLPGEATTFLREGAFDKLDILKKYFSNYISEHLSKYKLNERDVYIADSIVYLKKNAVCYMKHIGESTAKPGRGAYMESVFNFQNNNFKVLNFISEKLTD